MFFEKSIIISFISIYGFNFGANETLRLPEPFSLISKTKWTKENTSIISSVEKSCKGDEYVSSIIFPLQSNILLSLSKYLK